MALSSPTAREVSRAMLGLCAPPWHCGIFQHLLISPLAPCCLLLILGVSIILKKKLYVIHHRHGYDIHHIYSFVGDGHGCESGWIRCMVQGARWKRDHQYTMSFYGALPLPAEPCESFLITIAPLSYTARCPTSIQPTFLPLRRHF